MRWPQFLALAAVGLTFTCLVLRAGAQIGVPPASDIDLTVVNTFTVQGNVTLLIGPGGLTSASANVVVQTSDDAVVVVDSGRGNSAEQYVAAIRRISRKPIRFIINTQAALDHTGGNEALARS